MKILIIVHIVGALATGLVILRGSLTNQKLESAKQLIYLTVIQLVSGLGLAIIAQSGANRFCVNSVVYLTVVLVSHIALRRSNEKRALI